MGRGEPINIIIRGDLTMCRVQTNPGPQLDVHVTGASFQYGCRMQILILIRIIWESTIKLEPGIRYYYYFIRVFPLPGRK